MRRYDMVGAREVVPKLPVKLGKRVDPWNIWNNYESMIAEAYAWFEDYVRRRKVDADQPRPPAGMHWTYTPSSTLSGVTAVKTERRNGVYAAHYDGYTKEWVVDHLPTGRAIEHGLDKEATFMLVDELGTDYPRFLAHVSYNVDPAQFQTQEARDVMNFIIKFRGSIAEKPDHVREYTTIGDYTYQMLSKRKRLGTVTIKFAVKRKHDDFEQDIAPIELMHADGQWMVKEWPRDESVNLRNYLNRSKYVTKTDPTPVNA